ncbi:type IV pilin protein [Psychrobacter sp. FDAARGOS_221]|uniref:type IV pilin protein n=1 Tax=Psychrobacter sp. FDAARGOS_221 TaxID=1975705 RepID=UPI000BB58A76|nr:prepilin-type N-terminal cleavage/methylation domain-containing protein [Psychrobacter sp. FDAARGOS_221]PNK61132.1 prepilin-type N-terminal cleavage/methylation domain-containing protein [Psychrobacter sp. FDAARGOS_221]
MVCLNSKFVQTKAVQGYGLIELLMVMVVVGILVSIAYSSYQKYSVNARRVQMMVVLQNLAVDIHAQKLTQATYSNISLASVFKADTWTESSGVLPLNNSSHAPAYKYPKLGPALYHLSLTPLTADLQQIGSAHWQLIATPNPQAMLRDDGVLSINFKGLKCHRSQCAFDDRWQD